MQKNYVQRVSHFLLMREKHILVPIYPFFFYCPHLTQILPNPINFGCNWLGYGYIATKFLYFGNAATRIKI